MRPIKIAMMVSIGTLLIPLTGTAQVPEPSAAVFASGGGNSTQGGRVLFDTVGQPLIGVMTQAGQVNSSGFWYIPDRLNIGPTSAVFIVSFDAVVRERGVELSWQVESTTALAGFNVYRSRQAHAGYRNITADNTLPTGHRSFVDTDIRPGHVYWYRIGAIDEEGEFLSPPRSVSVPQRELTLFQNYPNPFNPSTRIDYYLPRSSHVTLTVYDVEGRRVRRLLDGPVSFGHRTVSWDGKDDRGMSVASGVYFYRLITANGRLTRKLMVLK